MYPGGDSCRSAALSQSQYPSSFDYQALLASGRGELFGEGNAKLPAPPMLMFDRITQINGDGVPIYTATDMRVGLFGATEPVGG